MARRRIGETMAIADDETKAYVLEALEGRVYTLERELADMVHKADEKVLSTAALVDQARRLVGAYDAWLQAGGG